MIEQTTVYATDIETNVQNLAAWLQDNASGYFDSIEIVTDGLYYEESEFGIRCTVGSQEFLWLEFTSTRFQSMLFSTENETSKTLISIGNLLYAYKCYKMGCGIVVQFAGDSPTDDSHFAFAITKDSGGNTVVVFNGGLSDRVTTSYPIYLASRKTLSLEASRCIVDTERRGKTVLSPLMMYDDADRILPHAFAVPYYQHTVDVLSQITLDGKDAIYCCGWLLMDE